MLLRGTETVKPNHLQLDRVRPASRDRRARQVLDFYDLDRCP